jgi:competence protein ComEA
MLRSGRPDGTTARDRLRSITPRWVPTEADLVNADAEPAQPPTAEPPSTAGFRSRAARHTLPDRPPPTWRLSADAVRGLASIGLAAVVGALLVVIVGWPRGEAAPEPAKARSDVDDAVGTQSASVLDPPVSESDVVVDVDGAVRRPGVVELPGGSRVVDAIDAAGGLRRGADTGALNLAQVLLDGEQVVVPRAGAVGTTDPAGGASPVPAPGSQATSPLVSINTATEAELETLPGIGPVLAAAIVEWRTQNGGFTSVEQLQDVSGIGPTTYAELAPLVRL